MTDIQRDLLAMQDVAYGDFSAKLLPTVARERVIGVRLPLLRKYAKSLSKECATQFIRELGHTYLEEDHLHAVLISQMRDTGECFAALEAFLPYVDNWSVCDSLRPKALLADREQMLTRIRGYLQSNHPYTVRFGIELLMVYFLDEHFLPTYPRMVATVHSEEYYVNMMIAWYFATALAKQWDACVPYLEQGRLSKWVHNKTIQKALESYRISPIQKAYLRTLRKGQSQRDTNYEIIRISDRPDLIERAAEWFASKWGVPLQAYVDSMEQALRGGTVPEWYVAMEGARMIGGLGVIENDFHDRPDLCPNVCAVYTEPDRRRQGIAGALLHFACKDMRDRGMDTLYLLTDHDSFYERYGWEFFCYAQGEGEQHQSRMYVHRQK